MSYSKKILFVSHDPGGYNLLSAVIDDFATNEAFEIHLLLAGSALGKYLDKKTEATILHSIKQFPCKGFPNEWDVERTDVEAIIKELRPDVVLTGTSINSNIERYSIHIGNILGIPTLSYIDSWIGENIRFKSPLIETYPRLILVCDEMMGSLYSSIDESISKVVIIGNPHLDRLISETSTTELNLEPETNRILFFAENMYHYYPNGKLNELQIIRSILENYHYDRNIRIALRPHPLESKDHWNEFIYKYENYNPAIEIFLDDIKGLRETINASSLVFGISSTALIEASLLKRNTFSYQVGILGDKELLYIPFGFFGIGEYSDLDEICRILSQTHITDGKNSRYFFSNAINQMKALISSL